MPHFLSAPLLFRVRAPEKDLPGVMPLPKLSCAKMHPAPWSLKLPLRKLASAGTTKHVFNVYFGVEHS